MLSTTGLLVGRRPSGAVTTSLVAVRRFAVLIVLVRTAPPTRTRMGRFVIPSARKVITVLVQYAGRRKRPELIHGKIP
jgi:hypothetical protein